MTQAGIFGRQKDIEEYRDELKLFSLERDLERKKEQREKTEEVAARIERFGGIVAYIMHLEEKISKLENKIDGGK